VRNNVRSRRLKLRLESFARLWINGGVQPMLSIVESGHRLVNRNVIRTLRSFEP
jgi:hypothetical protein